MTGSTFRFQTVRFSGPVRKKKLLLNGTLIRSATGFCDCFASSVLLTSSLLADASVSSARTAPAMNTSHLRLVAASATSTTGAALPDEHERRDINAHRSPPWWNARRAPYVL